MDRTELRLTGAGGQGIILATIILAEAAVFSGKWAAQSQAYGPEARGGMCKAEVIVSDEKIHFPKVVKPDFLMALTKEALDRYSEGVGEDCLILVDESLSIPEKIRSQTIPAPILRTAREGAGSVVTANIVAAGVIDRLLGLTGRKELEQAVLGHVPAGTTEQNLKALKLGEELGERLRAGREALT